MPNKNSFEIKWEDQVDFPDEMENSLSTEFSNLLESISADSVTISLPKVGEFIRAQIIQISPVDVLVEYNLKISATIPTKELEDKDGQLRYKAGDYIEAFVVSSSNGDVVLSKSMSHKLAQEKSLETAFEQQVPVKGRVQAINKGGAEVSLFGRKAFCPVSQMDIYFTSDLSSFVGKDLDFVIQKLSRKDIVVSHALVKRQQIQKQIDKLPEYIEERTPLDGKIKEIRDFGLFIDIEGLVGLVHISELGLSRNARPDEVYSVGEQVKVCVLKVDNHLTQNNLPRVSLSIKELNEDPWQHVGIDYCIGTSYSAKVVAFNKFGAIAELTPGLEGFIHLSEMSWTQKVFDPKKVLNMGDMITVRILDFDRINKKITLTLCALEDNPWKKLESEHQKDKVYSVKVQRLKSFGAICQFDEGLTGLLPMGSLKKAFGPSYRKKASPPTVLEVKIIKIDSVSKKILLSLPCLSEASEVDQDFKEYLASDSKDKENLKPKISGRVGTFGQILQDMINKK